MCIGTERDPGPARAVVAPGGGEERRARAQANGAVSFKRALGCTVPAPASQELGLPCWGQPGWKSQEEGREELGGQALKKGRLEAFWMGGAAPLSAPQALVLWAALGAAGKTGGPGSCP